MSSETKKAIYSVLSSDPTLVLLLGEDENGGPAIFNATFNQLDGEWGGAFVTFRESDGSAYENIRTATVDTEYWDIEVWSYDESALTVSDIAARIDELLHNQSLSVGVGHVYDCARSSQSADMYDPKHRLHFGLYRYKMIARRQD